MEFSKKRKIKYLFASMGPGETGQARALAKYIAKKGGKIFFCVRKEKSASFLSRDKEFKVFITETPEKFKKNIEKTRPDIILFFNSKIWGNFEGFSENPSFKKPLLTVCVDSNWLFNEKRYPNFRFIKWADKYLILFPKKVFELGLKKSGGDFIIQKDILKRIIPVGFIPSYKKPTQEKILKIRKKYKIQKEEKFIFSYFSGPEAGHRVFAFNNFIDATDRLVKKGKKIKALYVGPTKSLDSNRLKKSWLIKERGLSASDYFLTLASSDLIFQHQGMVTLAQAISAQVPVICNVHNLRGWSIPRLHFWEVGPSVRAGACEMFSKSSPIKKISERTEKLLYNPKIRQKMQKNQKLILEQGEKKSFEILKDLLSAKL